MHDLTRELLCHIQAGREHPQLPAILRHLADSEEHKAACEEALSEANRVEMTRSNELSRVAAVEAMAHKRAMAKAWCLFNGTAMPKELERA